MDSWENIILQWVNCLCDSSNSVKTIEELEDGKIYYNLINRILPWSGTNSNKSQRDLVLQFLKEEYPHFLFKNESSTMSKLCIASLLLSRLTLESIFHNMLCVKLEVGIQVKVKSILEIVYSLDKTITEQDLYNVFSLSSKNDSSEPKFISDEFVETPEPMDDDNVQLEQFKQIRQLKVQIETMGYENSDLSADIEDRDRQIKELQCKLKEALCELKQLKAENLNLDNNSVEPNDKEEVVSACQREGESLKKSIYRMHAENRQLQEQKKALSTEVKQLYVEKHQELKEKIATKKKAIELVKLTKIQERQIKDLQTKLQGFTKGALSVNSTKFNNSTFSVDLRNRNLEEIASYNKMKCLEKSVMKLKTKNYQLEKEKRALVIDELKLYKEKHYILKEKNANMKKAFEAMKLIKSQERQIKDLQGKLLMSEKNQAKLRTKHHELVQEKRALMDELKFYKGKYGFLKVTENKKK